MTDNITLPRAVGDEVRDLLCHADFTHFHFAAKRREMLLRAETALAALDAALAEPTAKPEPVVVEQLFVLAKLTVRRAADPDPWVWDRLDDDGTWKPFNPIIHGPDMWRLEQALRAALAEPDDTREPATVEQVIEANGPPWGPSASPAFFSGWRAAERHHGIVREDK